MLIKFSQVQDVLNAKLALNTFTGTANERTRLIATMDLLKASLNTRYEILLRHIIASLISYFTATTAAASFCTGVAGYLVTQYSPLIKNVVQWHRLSPENYPRYNSEFCTELMQHINTAHSAEELIKKLNSTLLEINKQNSIAGSTTSHLAAAICAELGYTLGTTQIAQNLMVYNIPGKAEIVKAVSTFMWSGLGLTVGCAAGDITMQNNGVRLNI